MASIQFGGGITKMIGSHSGNTFSSNKGGAYVKRRAGGTNPRTNNQTVRRVRLAQTSLYFTHTLSAAQQSAWRTFASVTPVVNRLGNTTFLSGQQMFCKLSCNLVQSGMAIIATPPASTAVGSPTGLVITAASGSPGALTIANTVFGTTGTDLVMMYVSPPLNPGVNFVSSKLRLLGTSVAVNFSAVVNAEYDALFGIKPLSAGQRIFVRINVVNTATGVMSAAFQSSSLWT